MRLVENCCGGGSIEIAWEQPRNAYDREGLSEASRSKEELTKFRARHKKCEPRQGAASGIRASSALHGASPEGNDGDPESPS